MDKQISKRDTEFVIGVAKDAGIEIDALTSVICIGDILRNDDRNDCDYEDFYYSAKSYFNN